jgi:CelD/BcsL family acetyltransferase involved in cellulose biosynthesis
MQTFCQRLAETRGCAVYSLVSPDRTIAAAVCFMSHRTLHFHHTAFDAEFAELSPGKLLLYFIIRDAFNRGFREVNLGLSKDDYKYWWSNRERALGRFLVYHRNRPALRLAAQLRTVWSTTKRSIPLLRAHRRVPRGDRG